VDGGERKRESERDCIVVSNMRKKVSGRRK